MRIAVLGGGLQGCCVALALAERGARVTLFDKNSSLLSRAASANEGKIHLGYVYAGDETLATARTMIEGALGFAPLMTRFLGAPPDFDLSLPFAYLVHRDSQKSVAEIAAHLAAVHAAILRSIDGRKDCYFGQEIFPPRRMSEGEMDGAFARASIEAAYATAEIAIDPLRLAARLRERIKADPNIETRLGWIVSAVADAGERLEIVGEGSAGGERETFDHVVNALWDGRLAIDATRGHVPDRPWLYRLKYGVRFRLPPAHSPLPSLTVVLGRFGDVVSYGDGAHYLSWYPAGMRSKYAALSPPDWPSRLEAREADAVLKASFSGMASILPSLEAFDPADCLESSVVGGAIFAWGSTDIDDRGSLLHRRCEIGLSSNGRYHSIDPGKLTMAPYFAALCAARILSS